MAEGSEILLFLRSAVSNPRRIGAVLPSSSGLGRLMCRHVELDPGGAILEVGAGTGVVTAALLEAGVPRDRLYVIELDKRLHRYLQNRFPGVTVLRGDAAEAADLLPIHRVGSISTVVSSLPISTMAFEVQQAITDAAFAVLKPGGSLIQYTYSPFPPMPRERLGIEGRCVGRIFRNVPPAAVWRFRRGEEPSAL